MIITKSEPFTKEENYRVNMNNKQVLRALAMDLKRAALGYHRGSTAMAERFFQEALKRRNEVDKQKLKPYLVKLLNDMESLRTEKKEKAAEDALLYSTIFQNASAVIISNISKQFLL